MLDRNRIRRTAVWAAAAVVTAAVAPVAAVATGAAPPDTLREPREVHLRNVRQLTFGGENAEAYWAPDGKRLILQSKREPFACDQIFVLDVESGRTQLVSTGRGRTTCSYFLPGTDRIVYASTHAAADTCPAPPDHSQGYVWKLYRTFEIYSARDDGSDLRQLTHHDGYDAEATATTDGKRIVFTSLRDGDLDLYSMKPDGSDVRRLTHELGYDGGAFYSRDGKHIVWRASRPKTDEDKRSYLELLAQDLIRPRALEIFVARADGSEARQITDNGDLRFERRRSQRSQFRFVAGAGRRRSAGTDHVRSHVRRLPDVESGRQAPRLRQQSQRSRSWRDQRVRRRLGREPEVTRADQNRVSSSN